MQHLCECLIPVSNHNESECMQKHRRQNLIVQSTKWWWCRGEWRFFHTYTTYYTDSESRVHKFGQFLSSKWIPPKNLNPSENKWLFMQPLIAQLGKRNNEQFKWNFPKRVAAVVVSKSYCLIFKWKGHLKQSNQRSQENKYSSEYIRIPASSAVISKLSGFSFHFFFFFVLYAIQNEKTEQTIKRERIHNFEPFYRFVHFHVVKL